MLRNRYFYSLYLFIFIIACLSTPVATKDSIDKAIDKENIEYLEKIINKEIRLEDEKLFSYVKENYLKLKKKKTKEMMEKAIKNKDIKTLKIIVEDKESLLSPDDKKIALSKLKEFVTEKIIFEINQALNNSDLDKAERILQSDDAKYLLRDEKLKITYKIRDTKRDRIFGEIKKAMDDVNLQKIYEIINSKDKEYLTLSDIESAKKYLDQYLKIDSYVNSYRQRRMEDRVRKIPEEIAKNIFLNPEKYIEPLVKTLISKEDNPFIKVKLIHDWICDNISYDVEMLLSGSIKDQDYINVLKKRKGVCYGYSNLFLKMANIAGFKDCIIINGNGKRSNYNKFDYSTAHSWNAIKIGLKWYLIDCTWDSGYIDGPGFYFNKKYSTAYLFILPRHNLYTHFPDNPKYQFYAPIIDKERFFEEPEIPGTFFYYGLDFVENSLKKKVGPEYKEVSFLIRYNSHSTSTMIKFKDLYNNELPDKLTITKIDSITYKIECKLPKNEQGSINIYAKRREDKNFENPISITRFDSFFIPKIDEFLGNGKITQEEREIFLNSFIRVEKNSLYYYNEDLFDIKKINTVIKIMTLTGDSLNWHDNVFVMNL